MHDMRRWAFRILCCLLLGSIVNAGVAWIIYRYDRVDSAGELHLINAQEESVLEADGFWFPVDDEYVLPTHSELRSMCRAIQLTDPAQYDHRGAHAALVNGRASRITYAFVLLKYDESTVEVRDDFMDGTCDHIGSWASVLSFEVGWPFTTAAWSSVISNENRRFGRDANEYEFCRLTLAETRRPITPIFHATMPPTTVYWTGFIMNSALYGSVLLIMVTATGSSRRFVRRFRGRCPCCAYDLRGEFTTGCPECGWKRAVEAESDVLEASNAFPT